MTTTKEENSELSLALQLAAIDRGDPVQRFIDSLEDQQLKAWAKETMLLVDVLHQQLQIVLIGTPVEAAHAAAWLRNNIGELAYRWSSLRQAVTKWNETDFRQSRMVVRR